MIIILEGSDKCGKSTIADKLSNEFKFNIVKCSAPKEGDDVYLEYMQKILDVDGDVVFDRLCYGEDVYGPIYRGKSQLDNAKLRNIELRLLANNPVMIYCHDKVSSIKKRFKECGETYAKPELIGKMLEMYEFVIGKANINVIRHQMKTKHDLTIGNKLNVIIESMQKRQPKFVSKFVTGNTVRPTILLVGDKRNENQRPEYRNVAQPFDFGPSSEFLFDEIEKAGLKLSDIALVNQDDVEPLSMKVIYSFVNPYVTVSLGEYANKLLKNANIIHDRLNHPQYELRFKRKEHNISKLLKKIKKTKEEHDEFNI